MTQTIFITGASSGIGQASAKLFFEKGWNVVATMRSPDKDTELTKLDPAARMLVLRLDLNDLSSIAPAIDAAIQKFHRINLLLNNAGFAQNAGTGFYGLPLVSVYTASKFALEGFTESLAFELASQNIFVKSVIPHGGVLATNFSVGSRSPVELSNAPESYKPYVEKTGAIFWKLFAGMNIGAGDVAGVVFEAATDGTDRLRYPLQGEDTKGLVKARYESKNDEEYVEYMRSVFR
ncbi:short-chain alcohol dehydrogenase [Lyophyllum atratum]|nr:short-chain alcohol dehydrogenase [Lyophyllum atratum]